MKNFLQRFRYKNVSGNLVLDQLFFPRLPASKNISYTSFSFSSASRVLNFFCTSLMKRNALLRFAAEATA